MAFELSEQIEAVVREIAMRKRVYPRRVANQQMSQDLATKQIGLMEAVLATLRQVETEQSLFPSAKPEP